LAAEKPVALMPVATSTRLGFAGKLPSRGDFVARGLPRSFLEAWDEWLGAVMPGSREILGESWLPAWLEAPIWRFALPGGQAGPDAVAGVLLPSVDRAGRHWPLTLAAVLPGRIAAPVPDIEWYAALEAIGLDAVLGDVTPEDIEARLPDFLESIAEMPSGWWTEGSPRVAAQQFSAGALPGPAAFARMLDDGFVAEAP
jgi:type VI secretion system protein ImpM